jgi:cytochrome P450
MILPSWIGSWIPMSGNRKIALDSKIMKEQCSQLIAENRAAMKESGGGKPDILSLLLKSGDLTDDDILNQMLTFLAAG